MYKFKFADIGEGLHEGVVAEIFFKEGDSVKEGDSLFSVETDKVTSDIPSPVSGTIKKIMMNKGDTIHVGQDIFLIDDGSGDTVEVVEEKPAQTAAQVSSSSSNTFYTFKFADIGEGLHEGVVAEIFFKEGDSVKEGDSLFSVETDKVTSDIPSPVSGTIKKIMMNKGDTIHVGQDIFLIDDGKVYNNASVAEAKADSEGGASVVGEVTVDNSLIDFSSFTQPTVTPATEVKKEEKIESDTQLEDGKVYSGAIEEEFDVIVVGSGPGGYLAAEEAGKSGLKTLIVEKWAWGGVCLNTGCIPTKALLKSTEMIHEVKTASKYGLVANFDKIKFDEEKTWKEMHLRKEGVVSKVSGSVRNLMLGSKCKILEAEAKFVGAREIEVNGKVYRAKNLILATGSRPKKLDMIPGFKEGYEQGKIVTSREAINYKEKLPKSLVIIGGGVIGVEFAQVFSLSGTKVTLLQNTDRLLPGSDTEVGKAAAKALKEMGVEVLFNVQTNKFENGKLYYTLDSKEVAVETDLILTATGRAPVSEGLAEVGIKLGKINEVIVDKHQRTNVKGVYAIGDVTAQNMLAHVAYAHALVAVQHILGNKEKSTYHGKAVPGCIYITPEISFIGMTEEEAKKAGRNVFSSKYLFEYLGKGIATVQTEGFVKLVVDKEFGEILGASIVGANSTDYIAEIALAMEQEVTVHELAHTIHPHPTFNEIVWEAARSAALKLDKENAKK
ncbi:dihydrolipoyl dehydrogenase [Mycoplasma anatis]|uniref:dihydrolipoyl dehydrogenase n=1 Tax=Mycoplasmopsis anatis TaxID=171279 RepID=UPI001C4E152D|nr:dihydrolipoyl dehydrogenase [Mycoplasmopsis anatis]MBW0594889.1 dihydrolipoyl dehydrogenase [Mycoplasmopsis anatis]MBW0595673.1 dihydrolipoyl dehydrogenase [Mycoplasmopsis anatis]MBW0596685.1 dihydrolipoyl dehydrogenase [Mycoplasmopsis anatis]MBW0598482.1 dihydrolipoyl dehydrogenase [Mycoplasmopsis anatis]MBW0599260.1 dihydrolipoyl dehydrogenase [Mycoplasmopsis anatis]